jgi:hypothetical protein
MVKDLESILDQIYDRIHQFLVSKAGEELNEDLIDISLEATNDGEIKVAIDLYLEVSPFSDQDVQKLANEAVEHGIKVTDQIIPEFIINIKYSK